MVDVHYTIREEAFRAKLEEIFTDDAYWREINSKQNELQSTNIGTFWKPEYAPEAYDAEEYKIYGVFLLEKCEEKKAEHERDLHQYDRNCPTCLAKEKLTHEKSCAWHNCEECDCGKSVELEGAVEGDNELEEVKNTCKRCGKVWYLGAGELEFLKERYEKVSGLTLKTGKIAAVMGLFNPMLGAQNITATAVMTQPMLKLKEELEEKSKCPECQSKNIERVVADANDVPIEKTDHHKEKRGSSKIEELEKLAVLKKEGLIDDEEFKQMKKEIMGK